MNVMEGRYEFDPAAANAQLNQYPQQRVYVADPNAYAQLPYDDGTYQAAPPAQQWSTHGPVNYPNGEWSAPVTDPYNQSVSVMRAEGEQGHYLHVHGAAPVNPHSNQSVPEQKEEEGEDSDVETSSDDDEEEKEQPRVQLRATAARPAQQVPAPVVAEPTPPVEAGGRNRKATATSSAEDTNTPRARRGYNRATEAIKGTEEYVKIRRLNNEASARCRDKKRKEQEKKEEQLRATLAGLCAVVESLKTDVAGLKEEKKQLSSLSELRDEVDSLKTEVAGLKKEKKQLSSTLTELRDEVDSLRADVAGVKGEVTNVRQQCNTKFVRLHARLNAERAELL